MLHNGILDEALPTVGVIISAVPLKIEVQHDAS